jgi:hypothetical protein
MERRATFSRLAYLPPIQRIETSRLLKLLNSTSRAPPVTMSSQLLRLWLDEWLNSGYKDGIDRPRERNLKNCCGALMGANLLNGWILDRNEKGDGLWLRFDANYDLANAGDLKDAKEELDFAQHVLRRFFLTPDLPFKLARCRWEGCAAYFILYQTNRVYTRGTLCVRCRRRAKSLDDKQSMEALREDAQDKLRKRAAAKFARQILKEKDLAISKRLKERIVADLNNHISRSPKLRMVKPNGLTTKWVTLAANWNPIRELSKKRLVNG